MKRTKHYLVTHIDPYLFPQPQDLEDKIFNALGVWSATDEVVEDIREYTDCKFKKPLREPFEETN